jgi:hypothetical protein
MKSISEEIFSNATLMAIEKPEIVDSEDNQDNLTLSEITTPLFGRCYTLCKRKPLKLWKDLKIWLKPNWNYKLFIHQPGEELWVGGTGNFPNGEAIILTLGEKGAHLVFNVLEFFVLST